MNDAPILPQTQTLSARLPAPLSIPRPARDLLLLTSGVLLLSSLALALN